MLAAAAAVVVAAATVIGRVKATAVAQQQNENDDPAHIAAAEPVVTHNDYLRDFTCDFRRSFQVMTQRKICYS